VAVVGVFVAGVVVEVELVPLATVTVEIFTPLINALVALPLCELMSKGDFFAFKQKEKRSKIKTVILFEPM
jgi:hypothetical protein